MKFALSTLLLTLSLQNAFADQIRNTKEYPLTKYEKVALKASTSLAKELGQEVSAQCVNAAFKAGTLPVRVQFFKVSEVDGPFCVDSHYSIVVSFDEEGKISKLEVLDN